MIIGSVGRWVGGSVVSGLVSKWSVIVGRWSVGRWSVDLIKPVLRVDKRVLQVDNRVLRMEK